MTASRLIAKILGFLSLISVVVFNHERLYDDKNIITTDSVTTTQQGLKELASASFPNNTIDAIQGNRKLFKLSEYLDPKSTTERIQLPLDQNDLYLQNPTPTKTTPYSLYNILLTLPNFRRELFILYYSAKDDEFHVYIDESKDGW